MRNRFVRTPDGQVWDRFPQLNGSGLQFGVTKTQSHGGFEFSGLEDSDFGDIDDSDIVDVYGMDVYAAAKRAGKLGKLKKLQLKALARQADGFTMPGRAEQYGMVLPIPFEFTVDASDTFDIEIKPQNRITVTNITIASPNAKDLLITALRVGTDDQWAGSLGGWNGDLISSQSPREGLLLRGSTAAPGIVIRMQGRNLAAEERTFYGHFLGPAVRFGNGNAG